MVPSLLITEHLSKSYGDCRALEGLNLTIEPGEIFGLLGPNGSGKSTALRLFLGFIQPTSGNAKIGGHDCWNDGVAARRQVAYLPGELRLYDNMTGCQLIRFLARLRGSDLRSQDQLASRFDIDLSRPIAQLSSGMKHKLALLQVLLAQAPLLIMDEPTNTLDPTMRQELLDQLRMARKQGASVLFSSHVLSEVEQVCDRVGILQRGRLVHVQIMRELRSANLIRARFAGPVPPLPALPGLVERERDQSSLTVEYAGSLSGALHWLAGQSVQELRIEPLGLGGIYRRFHGAEA
jgi:ABC-2 type transport system ATP-binding protein